MCSFIQYELKRFPRNKNDEFATFFATQNETHLILIN